VDLALVGHHQDRPPFTMQLSLVTRQHEIYVRDEVDRAREVPLRIHLGWAQSPTRSLVVAAFRALDVCPMSSLRP